jgi:hypothetical protein
MSYHLARLKMIVLEGRRLGKHVWPPLPGLSRRKCTSFPQSGTTDDEEQNKEGRGRG